MKAKRKVYVTGGVVPKKYKDAKGTYAIGANGQKIYDGVPVKKPAAKATTKPAAKTAGAAKKQLPPLTAGESIGRMLQKGDVSGAARSLGEAVVGAPKELYGALRRSLR